MPITVRYDPAFANMANLARDSGQGQFLQQQDRFNFDVRRFDEGQALQQQQLAEQQRQYDGAQQYKYNALAQQGDLANRQLGQQAYQYDASLAFKRDSAAEALAENQRRDADANAFREQEFGLRERQLTRQEKGDLNAIKREHLQRQYATSMQAAQKIEDIRGKYSPEQFNQAKQQWLSQYGGLHGGQYPFDMPMQEDVSDGAVELARESLVSAFGEDFPLGMEQFYGEVQDGRFQWYDKPKGPASLWEEKQKQRHELEKQAAGKADDLEKERVKQEAAQAKRLEESQIKYAQAQQQRMMDREKWLYEQREKLKKHHELEPSFTITPEMERELQESARAIHPDVSLDLYGIPEPPEPRIPLQSQQPRSTNVTPNQYSSPNQLYDSSRGDMSPLSPPVDPAPPAPDIQEINGPEEFAAAPAGTLFMRDGQLWVKNEDGTISKAKP